MLAARLVEIYKADAPDALTVILEADGFGDLLERAEFLDRISDQDRQITDRVRGLRGKWILREAARSLLPAHIVTRPKIGFRVPVSAWFRGPLRTFLCDHLHGAGSRTRLYYDSRRLDDVLDEHVSGRQNHEKLLWTLLSLEVWHRAYA